MNQLLVVIPYCSKDTDLVQRLLKWCEDSRSNGLIQQPLLLAADSTVPKNTIGEINSLARCAFASVDSILVKVPEDRQQWGLATKAMFERVANQIQECYKLPWFWMEPDCVPLIPDWAEALAHGYAMCPKRFMGAHVTSDQLTKGPPHMAGPGIYPNNAYIGFKDYLGAGDHFDLCIAPYVLPRSSNTRLIQHFWGKADLVPSFVLTRSETDHENVLPLSFIRSDAVIFHRNKDGTLINLLRQRSNGSDTIAIQPETEPEHPLAFDTIATPEEAKKQLAAMQELLKPVASEIHEKFRQKHIEKSIKMFGPPPATTVPDASDDDL